MITIQDQLEIKVSQALREWLEEHAANVVQCDACELFGFEDEMGGEATPDGQEWLHFCNPECREEIRLSMSL